MWNVHDRHRLICGTLYSQFDNVEFEGELRKKYHLPRFEDAYLARLMTFIVSFTNARSFKVVQVQGALTRSTTAHRGMISIKCTEAIDSSKRMLTVHRLHGKDGTIVAW